MTSTHSSASPASFSNSTPCGDSVDMDSFINYESSVMTSPSSTSRGKAAVIERPSAPSSSSSYALQQSQHQTFSGPSHQYEQYKQQTGLPVGGLATTLALNDLSYGMNSGLPMGSDSLFDLGVSDGLYGFNPMDGRSLSIGDGTDLDLDMDSPNNDLPAFFYPAGKDEFVDPTALNGQEEPSPTTTTVGRVWPGMHQQAAMAKAAQQQKQQEMMRQQQQQNQLTAQRPVPTRGNRATGHQPSDPIVEERISRLLHQMRQNSSNSPDEAATPTNSLPHMARLKKEEDDMDEDERLLASEEGKKLSSKERRQLRNKVSARAFRSRRKEYISQLEGEVNKGTQENSELKERVRALMEENSRLTELTKMLLSSPAFAGFMNELAVDQASQSQAQEQPAPQPTALQPNTRKDVNPHQASQMQPQIRQQQIGLALMPEIDFSTLDLNAGWNNSGMDMHFTNTQVFALTEVPEGPALDAETLSGKTTSFVPSSPPSDDSKPQVPTIERAPVTDSAPETAAVTPDENIEFDESDPAFTLFADLPTPKPSTNDDFENLFGSITPEKVFARLELVVEDEAVANDTLAAEQLEHMLSSMQDSYDRIGNITFHLR